MTINVCDICGGRHNVNRLCYPYDRRPDGAGSSETVSEVFDLCEKHEIQVLRSSMKEIKRDGCKGEFEVNLIIIKYIKMCIREYNRNAKTKN